MDKKLIIWFKDIGIGDIPFVGGKNAAIGEMMANLSPKGIKIPNGFAVTTSAYELFIEEAGIGEKINNIIDGLKKSDVGDLKRRGEEIRRLMLGAEVPAVLELEILQAYRKLGGVSSPSAPVAVRSSATAEDLPTASFAGQQDTFLNVRGEKDVVRMIKKCFASFFTDRAISYREDKGFSHSNAAISVAVQKMVRSDIGASGVAFTLDTETGLDKVIVIESSYGLGEAIVQGKVNPDEFIIFKGGLDKGLKPIIGKTRGAKEIKFVYSSRGTAIKRVERAEALKFSIEDGDALAVARFAKIIEEYFSKRYGATQSMDIEWAKDGKTGEIFILQARPETVHRAGGKHTYVEYEMEKVGQIILTGTAVGTRIGAGRAKVIKSAKDISQFSKGEVLVTEMTDPDWEPVMKMASAIVAEKGGRTSHAAIVSRELGIPCVVGAEKATRLIKPGEEITVDCSSGATAKIFKGNLPFKIVKKDLTALPKLKTKIMLNIGSPDEAFKYADLPVAGVGLGRLEFIINSTIGIHPNVFAEYKKLKDSRKKSAALRQVLRVVDSRTAHYADKEQFYIDKLAEGIGKIAAAFSPHDVIIRCSDFKTNEYRSLIGGELYEPVEENPMLGLRGASRYYHKDFERAFGLECLAIRKARDEMGLKNILPMIPFCRTPEEGSKTVKIMERYGLKRSEDKTLRIFMMCEIPSNVILADEFLDIFDGMSIGSNDLTQLVMGIDRDSETLSGVANETNPAVKEMIKDVIAKCRARGKYIGICGQAPSDYPDFAKFLVKEGIESISLNPDSVLKTILLLG